MRAAATSELHLLEKIERRREGGVDVEPSPMELPAKSAAPNGLLVVNVSNPNHKPDPSDKCGKLLGSGLAVGPMGRRETWVNWGVKSLGL